MQVIDYEMTIADAKSGTQWRNWLNGLFSAVVTQNSGNEAPTTTYAFMWWYDTSNSTYYYLKQRNADNSAWNTIIRYKVSDKTVDFMLGNSALSDLLAAKADASDSYTIDEVNTIISNLDGGAPTELNTLKKLADALAGKLATTWKEEATATLNLTGLTMAVTTTARFKKMGNFVHLSLDSASWTSNASTLTITGVPLNFRPSANRSFTLRGINNGVQLTTPALAVLTTDGTIIVYSDFGGAGWSTSNTKGIYTFETSYSL